MHVQLDSANRLQDPIEHLGSLLDMASNRFDGILDAILTRYNLCRLYGVIHVDVSTVSATSCTGPIA